MVFLMIFRTDWNSFVGPTIRLSINSSSGAMEPRNSSIALTYESTLLIVRSESGFFPIRSYSPAMGWNKVEKWLAKLAPEVNRPRLTVQCWLAYPDMCCQRTINPIREWFCILQQFLDCGFHRSEVPFIGIEFGIIRFWRREFSHSWGWMRILRICSTYFSPSRPSRSPWTVFWQRYHG